MVHTFGFGTIGVDPKFWDEYFVFRSTSTPLIKTLHNIINYSQNKSKDI